MIAVSTDHEAFDTGCGEDEMSLRECIEYIGEQKHSRELQSILNHLERYEFSLRMKAKS